MNFIPNSVKQSLDPRIGTYQTLGLQQDQTKQTWGPTDPLAS